MNISDISKASIDDLVFEFRNKNYGAYFLRKIYNRNLITSAGVATGLFLLFIAIPTIINAISSAKTEDKKIDLSEVDLAPPPPEDKTEPPPPEVEPPPPLKSTIQFTPPEPVEDNKVTETRMTTTDDLKDLDISNKTEEGDKNGVDRSLLDENVGKGPVQQEDNQVYTYVEQMPEFPGGEAKLLKYLADNIKYPPMASENDIQGRVIIEFVVGADGKIKDAKVAKGIGFGCDEEALRVVKSMPPWNPGKQNGRSVNVNYRVPVKFTLR